VPLIYEVFGDIFNDALDGGSSERSNLNSEVAGLIAAQELTPANAPPDFQVISLTH
jgi:hypothetical protein